MAAPPPNAFDFFEDLPKDSNTPKVNVEVRVNEPSIVEKIQSAAHDPAYADHTLPPPFETRGQALIIGLRRLVALVFDAFLTFLTAFLLGFVALFSITFILGAQGIPEAIAILLGLIGALLVAIFGPPILIDVLMPLWWKTSPGKWLMGLWFENPSGEPLEFMQLLKRRALFSMYLEVPYFLLAILFYYQLVTQSLLWAVMTYYGLVFIIGIIYFELFFRARTAPWDKPFHVQIFAKPKYPVWLFGLVLILLGLWTADTLNVTTAKETAVGNAISQIQGALMKAREPRKKQPKPQSAKPLPDKKKQNAN